MFNLNRYFAMSRTDPPNLPNLPTHTTLENTIRRNIITKYRIQRKSRRCLAERRTESEGLESRTLTGKMLESFWCMPWSEIMGMFVHRGRELARCHGLVGLFKYGHLLGSPGDNGNSLHNALPRLSGLWNTGPGMRQKVWWWWYIITCYH